MSLGAVRELLRNSWFEVSGVGLPRALLGTSPFIGAGQFGPRASAYARAFYNRPDRVASIIIACAELGIMGIQPLPYGFIVEAIRRAQRELGVELVLVGTIGPWDPLGDLRAYDGLALRAALTHGALTDTASSEELKAILGAVRDEGLLAGYVTHAPMKLIRRLQAGELPRPDLIMLPFNALGYLMDAPPDQLAGALRQLGLPVIGKKVLAAGRLRPDEAFRFALGFGILSGLAIGMVSREEAEETLTSLALAMRDAHWPT